MVRSIPCAQRLCREADCQRLGSWLPEASCQLSLALIGNPGTGKSTLFNCHAQTKLFHAGNAYDGIGVTRELDVREHGCIRYMDTPGLSDIVLREIAAKAIDSALKHGGAFKIIFVFVTSSGRIQADDLTTMQLVVEAANQITQNSYSILVNKCEKRWLQKVNREEWIENLEEALTSRNIPLTEHIHFAPRIEDLVEEEDMIVDLDPSTINFLADAPTLYVDTEQIREVDFRMFEELKREVEKSQQEAADALKQAKLAREEKAKVEADFQRALAAHEQSQEELKRAREVARRAGIDAEKLKIAAKHCNEECERRAFEHKAAEAQLEREKLDALAEKKRIEDQTKADMREVKQAHINKQRLVELILDGRFAWFNALHLGFVKSKVDLANKINRHDGAHRVVIWKGGCAGATGALCGAGGGGAAAMATAAAAAATAGGAAAAALVATAAAANRVNGFAVFDRSNRLLGEGGHRDYRDVGSKVYSLDADDNHMEWTMKHKQHWQTP